MLKESQAFYEIDSSETILKIESINNQINEEELKESEEDQQFSNEILIFSSDCKY